MSQNSKLNVDAIIVVAEWLSELFGAPATTEHITQIATSQAQESLQWIGEQLNASAQIQALNAILTRDHPAPLAVHLQRRYTTLFEGIFKHRAVLPYESAWRGGDLAIAEMKAVLRALDVHVDKNYHEPADHLAIELAALSVALRDEQYRQAAELVERLEGWVPSFSTALHLQDKDGFYAAAADLLLALLHNAHNALALHIPKRYEGEFA
ncbi:MAG: molecular chaperone TorD family protein [Thiopseudomonas sp.]|nr:molecular chaperone TorD family protein [Thiopseudomonas sp.]MCK9465653.1 molecular chaperone TorD family protein [Thiopseudomonas sp.]